MDKILNLMRALQEGSASNQRQLAEMAGFSLAMVNSLLKNMLNRKLIEISTENEKFYRLSEKGKIFLDNLLCDKQAIKPNLQVPQNILMKTAVILVAGDNKNFDIPVCLLELKDGYLIIDRIIDALLERGIVNIILILGYKSELIEAHLKNRNVTILYNYRYKWTGTMASLATAAPYIDSDFLVIEGDHVFENRMLDKAIQCKERSSIITKTPGGTGHDAYVEFGPDGNIFRISKDIHQFNHLHGILAGFQKISFELFTLMMDRYKDNANPYLNYEYVIEVLARSYKVPPLYIDDVFSYDINDNFEYEKLIGIHYPLLLNREIEFNKEDIKENFCSFMEFSKNDILQIDYMGGMTNNNFKVETKKMTYVFRVPGKCTEKMISRVSEKYNNKLGYLLDINVDTLYFDDESGVKITEYIESSETLSSATARLEANIAQTTLLLKKLHESSVDLQSNFDVFEELLKYEQLNDEANGSYYEEYEEIRKEFFKCKERLNIIGLDIKSCHNDLVAENFIKNDQRMYLIDWEYAGMNDPMWDIAAHLLECEFGEAETELFLNYYFDGETILEKQRQKILIFKFLQDVLWTVWTNAKEANGEDFGNYGMLRMERAKVLIQQYISTYESEGK